MPFQSNNTDYRVAETIPDVPGLDSLGYGYDVFSRYANTLNATKKLFNLGDQVVKTIDHRDYHIPRLVEFRFVNENGFDIFSGKTLKEYISSLSSTVKVGGEYDCFSGSLAIDFSGEILTSSNYSFTKVINVIKKWILTLPDETELISYLNDVVKKDFDSLNPSDYNSIKKFFDKYGTHYLAEIVVGAKASYNSAVNDEVFQSKFSISTVAEMSYKELTQFLTVEEKAVYGESISSYKNNSQYSLHTVGGKPEYANAIMNGDYTKWIESIGENPQFCDFTPDGLRPIWNLCTDSAKKRALEEAFPKYAKSRTPKIATTCINGLAVVYSSSSSIAPPYGYTKINYDINAGHGHDFLYLCYKNGLDNDADNLPITGIKVVTSDNALTQAPDAGYTLIPHDLNAGLGGKFIYITYTTQKTAGEPIRGIKIIHGKNADIPAPYGYEKIPQDLKESTGGEFVYICTSRHFNN